MSSDGGFGGRAASLTSNAQSLQLALTVLAIAACFLAGAEVALFLHRPTGPIWVLLLFIAVAVEYVLAGLLAWARRPSDRTGPLLCWWARACSGDGEPRCPGSRRRRPDPAAA